MVIIELDIISMVSHMPIRILEMQTSSIFMMQLLDSLINFSLILSSHGMWSENWFCWEVVLLYFARLIQSFFLSVSSAISTTVVFLLPCEVFLDLRLCCLSLFTFRYVVYHCIVSGPFHEWLHAYAYAVNGSIPCNHAHSFSWIHCFKWRTISWVHMQMHRSFGHPRTVCDWPVLSLNFQ